MKLFGESSKESANSLNCVIAYSIGATQIDHNAIEHLDDNLGFAEVHSQNNGIESFHDGLGDRAISEILHKLVDDIIEVLLTTVDLHKLDFAELVVGGVTFLHVELPYFSAILLSRVFFDQVYNLLQCHIFCFWDARAKK